MKTALLETYVKTFSYKGHVYEWNEDDMVYYREDVDDVFFYDVPEKAKVLKQGIRFHQ